MNLGWIINHKVLEDFVFTKSLNMVATNPKPWRGSPFVCHYDAYSQGSQNKRPGHKILDVIWFTIFFLFFLFPFKFQQIYYENNKNKKEQCSIYEESP